VKQSVITWLVGATTVASFAGLGLSAALTTDITLVVDGHATTVRAADGTVNSLLKQQGVPIGLHDLVTPRLSEPLADGMTVTVAFGRQVDITIDGEPSTVWTTAQTVDGLLAGLELTGPGTVVTPARDTSITDEGLDVTVTTPKMITVTVDGLTRTEESTLPTVADVLSADGISLGAADRVSVATDTPLTDGLSVKVQRVAVLQESATVEVPFQKVEKKSSSLAKGKTKVQTAGVNGTNTQVFDVVMVDGAEESRTLVSDTVDTPPVDEVTLIGTRVASASTGSVGGSGFFRSQDPGLVDQIRAANGGDPLIQLLADQVGKGYRNGGNGPDVFDCSGLTSWAFRSVYGISLPRTAAGQGAAGTPVDWGSIQPGDIIWSSGHVAVYVGNGLTIHAENPSAGVTVGSAGFLQAQGYGVVRFR